MILIFVGSRANFGRLYNLIEMLIQTEYEVGIIQGSYTIPVFTDKVVFTIDNIMYNDTNSNMVTSASLIAQITSSYVANLKEKPKLAVVHGDRFENLGFAFACAYNGIPLLHTEGGEVSGNIDDKIRNAITSFADYHCVTSEGAKTRLESRYLDNVYVVGSPALDYVKKLNLIRKDSTISDYYLVLYNPCPEDDYKEFVEAMIKLSKVHKLVWVNPNTDPGSKELLKDIHKTGVEFVKSLTPPEYYMLLSRCKMLIGNSSSGIKEGAFLGTPYILVGQRQKSREVCSNVTRVECNSTDILNAVIDLTHKMMPYNGLFGNGNAATNIISVIERVMK